VREERQDRRHASSTGGDRGERVRVRGGGWVRAVLSPIHRCPKLVGDVDICGAEMGPDWHLITEGDLEAMQERDFQAVADVWNHQPVGGQGLSEFFASLQIWVRASDGTIAQATLAPGAGPDRVTPLAVEPTSTNHYEGSLGLRCLRGATTRR
jgi:hypothetical protein